jgi:hypothetical protein
MLNAVPLCSARVGKQVCSSAKRRRHMIAQSLKKWPSLGKALRSCESTDWIARPVLMRMMIDPRLASKAFSVGAAYASEKKTARNVHPLRAGGNQSSEGNRSSRRKTLKLDQGAMIFAALASPRRWTALRSILSRRGAACSVTELGRKFCGQGRVLEAPANNVAPILCAPSASVHRLNASYFVPGAHGV